VNQPAIEQTIEVSLPCYRKRGTWFFAVLSEKEAIQVFKSDYDSVGSYITTGERIVSEAFQHDTELCTYHEFMDALNQSIAQITSISRELKTSDMKEESL
jgi:hypothetical protein